MYIIIIGTESVKSADFFGERERRGRTRRGMVSAARTERGPSQEMGPGFGVHDFYRASRLTPDMKARPSKARMAYLVAGVD